MTLPLPIYPTFLWYLVTNTTTPSLMKIPRLSPLALFLCLIETSSLPRGGAPPVMYTNAASIQQASLITYPYVHTRSCAHTTPSPLANADHVALTSTNASQSFL